MEPLYLLIRVNIMFFDTRLYLPWHLICNNLWSAFMPLADVQLFKKAPGPDNINNRILKEFAEPLSKPLSNL